MTKTVSKVERKAYLSSADVMLARLGEGEAPRRPTERWLAEAEGLGPAEYAGGASLAESLGVGKSRTEAEAARSDLRVANDGSRKGLLRFQEALSVLTFLESIREGLSAALEDEGAGLLLRENLPLRLPNMDMIDGDEVEVEL